MRERADKDDLISWFGWLAGWFGRERESWGWIGLVREAAGDEEDEDDDDEC